MRISDCSSDFCASDLVAAVVEHDRVVRLQAQRAVIGFQRPLVVAQLLPGHAQIAVGGGVVRLELDRPAQILEREGVLAAMLPGGAAREVPRRSEDGRAGNEYARPCTYRRDP